LHLSTKNILSCALVIRDCYYLPPLSQVRLLFTNTSSIVVLCSDQKFINVSHEKSTLKSRSQFFHKSKNKKSRIVITLLKINPKSKDDLQMFPRYSHYGKRHLSGKLTLWVTFFGKCLSGNVTIQETFVNLTDSEKITNTVCQSKHCHHKNSHSLDGQHQGVDRTPRGRVNQNDRDQWRKYRYVHGVAKDG